MQLYYWIVQLVKYRTEEAYQKVKEYFKLVVFTDKDEEQEVLVHLLNFCAYAMRKGDFSYGQEILNVYKEAAASNKLNKYLTGQTYLNIVSLINIKSKLFQIEKKRRDLQIKCLIELKENPELIRNQCYYFLLYLKRDKFTSKESKLSHINYIKVIQKLQNQVPKQEIIAFIDDTLQNPLWYTKIGYQNGWNPTIHKLLYIYSSMDCQ